jgi:hypothetical protein
VRENYENEGLTPRKCGISKEEENELVLFYGMLTVLFRCCTLSTKNEPGVEDLLSLRSENWGKIVDIENIRRTADSY